MSFVCLAGCRWVEAVASEARHGDCNIASNSPLAARTGLLGYGAEPR
jgi:hypothetical protein